MTQFQSSIEKERELIKDISLGCKDFSLYININFVFQIEMIKVDTEGTLFIEKYNLFVSNCILSILLYF